MTASKERLHLKLRIVLTKPMTKAQATKLVKGAVRTGYVPNGIELRWIDWRTGEGGKARGGSYVAGDAHNALVEFWRAINHPATETRIEVVGD